MTSRMGTDEGNLHPAMAWLREKPSPRRKYPAIAATVGVRKVRVTASEREIYWSA